MYREIIARCPRCRTELEPTTMGGRPVLACQGGAGQLVAEDGLRAMYHEAALVGGRDVSMPDLMEHEYGDPPRPCPVCGEDMARVWYDSLPLDQCPSDGVWFDRDELGTLLGYARHPQKPPEPPKLRRG